jgi:O-antigen/teichoic acid export membrane protein
MTAQPAERSGRGLLYILAATVVAGGVGYLIQILAPALLPDADAYLTFSVFWSALYLCVAAIAGVQQEVTRATRPSPVPPRNTVLRTFTLLSAGVLAIVSVLVGVLLAPTIFPTAPVVLTTWFGVGIVGYLLSAVFAGVLYGLALWGPIAALIAADAVVRGVLVTVALAVDAPEGVVAAAVSVPFVLSFGLLWLVVRKRVIGRFMLDVGPRRLSVNALGTVTAAAATGIMVTGLPLLLRTTMPAASAVAIASLVLTITLTRAPLIVPLMALQSFLIVDFRGTGRRTRLARYLGMAAAATALATLAAWLWAPALVGWLTGGRYAVAGWAAAGIVLSAGLVAMMCLTGPALLSASRHGPYVAGWVSAAAATVVLLLLPLAPEPRTVVALMAAPALGLAVHFGGLRRSDAATARDPGAADVLG